MKRHVFYLLAGMTILGDAAHAQNYCKLGEQKWTFGCEASCTASWGGSDCPKSCTATAPAGFVIMEYGIEVLSQNNGGHSASKMAAGQSFDYKREVEQAYSNALDIAGKAGVKSAEGKIKEDMNNALKEAERFNSSHQLVRLEVNASKHGKKYIDEKRGWSKAKVNLLVKCVVPENLESQLLERYSLQ